MQKQVRVLSNMLQFIGLNLNNSLLLILHIIIIFFCHFLKEALIQSWVKPNIFCVRRMCIIYL